eukprot:gene9743-2070_t
MLIPMVCLIVAAIVLPLESRPINGDTFSFLFTDQNKVNQQNAASFGLINSELSSMSIQVNSSLRPTAFYNMTQDVQQKKELVYSPGFNYTQFRFYKSSVVLASNIPATKTRFVTLGFNFFKDGKSVGYDTLSLDMFQYTTYSLGGRRYLSYYRASGTMCLVFDASLKKMTSTPCGLKDGYFPRYVYHYGPVSGNISPTVNLYLREKRDPFVKEIPYRVYGSHPITFLLGMISVVLAAISVVLTFIGMLVLMVLGFVAVFGGTIYIGQRL